jgi:hypothetical protein
MNNKVFTRVVVHYRIGSKQLRIWRIGMLPVKNSRARRVTVTNLTSSKATMTLRLTRNNLVSTTPSHLISHLISFSLQEEKREREVKAHKLPSINTLNFFLLINVHSVFFLVFRSEQNRDQWTNCLNLVNGFGSLATATVLSHPFSSSLLFLSLGNKAYYLWSLFVRRLLFCFFNSLLGVCGFFSEYDNGSSTTTTCITIITTKWW